jgi:hypothetical protein
MGDELKATRELEGLKEQMEAIADHFEENGDLLDGTLDSDAVVCILRSLLQGATAEATIERYGFEVE